MPYSLHAIGSEPSTGAIYETRELALGARVDGQTVSRLVTDDEREAYQYRERRRFSEGEYVRVPWSDRLAFDYAHDVDAPQNTIRATMRGHFAHMSVKAPGMIAYTPDDAFGVDDRQLRVKPGKYLEQFASKLFDTSEIAAYVATVKAFTGKVQFAKTPEEIARVYCAPNGPGSCMTDFDRDNTPVRVYGNSDLAIAYIGVLAEDCDHDRISARCIVWPEKKVYGRAYGDENVIRELLKAEGYASGSMRGARVRAIQQYGDTYVMPYVDGIDRADLTSDRKWFVLGRGAYDCQNTGGTTEVGATCENCGESCDSDETYCSSCQDDACYCERCGETYFDSDSGQYYEESGVWICNDCDVTHDCEHCDHTFSEYEFNSRERRNRDMRLCSRCEDNGVTTCDRCESWTESTNEDCHCSDCAEELAEERRKANSPRPRPRGKLIRLHRVGVAPQFVTDIRCLDGAIVPVTVVSHIGPFYIHETVWRDTEARNPRHWTVTHVGTLLSATANAPTRQDAEAFARELIATGADWSFTATADMPNETRRKASTVVRSRNW